jgi:uncharacterized protein with PQ loop repeat
MKGDELVYNFQMRPYKSSNLGLKIIGLVGTYLKLIIIFVSSKNKMSMELEVR